MIGHSDIDALNKIFREMNLGFGAPQGGIAQSPIPVLVIQSPGGGASVSDYQDDGGSEFGNENSEEHDDGSECHCSDALEGAIGELQAVLDDMRNGNKGPEQTSKIEDICGKLCDDVQHMATAFNGDSSDDEGGDDEEGETDYFAGLGGSSPDDEDDDSDDEDDSEDEESGGFGGQKQNNFGSKPKNNNFGGNSDKPKKPNPFTRE